MTVPHHTEVVDICKACGGLLTYGTGAWDFHAKADPHECPVELVRT